MLFVFHNIFIVQFQTIEIINVKMELSRGMYLLQSLVMYNEARPYQCNQCGHKFSHNSEINNIMVMHTDKLIKLSYR